MAAVDVNVRKMRRLYLLFCDFFSVKKLVLKPTKTYANLLECIVRGFIGASTLIAINADSNMIYIST